MTEKGTNNRSAPSDFKVGEWWARPDLNRLEKPGGEVSVEAKSMAVLVCLARHAPVLVSKERLLEEVWTGAFVGDDVISHAIWELRKAFGDSARDPEYIQTVARKGYRLVAEVLRPQGSPLPMAGVRIDHYDLRDEIGRGSMGVVYEAVDRRLGRTVAVKFLAPELTRDAGAGRRFEREARLAASLEHPNLATVHEVGETSEGYRYLVSAFYRGGSLKDRLADGPLPEREALGLTRQLLSGLAAAHDRGIVHRDVKPANLFLDEHGTLKIGDFGIAKLLGATDLTGTGAPLGTPAYKSPEQARGRAIDHRSDLWAVGVVLYELLTGRRPFEAESEHLVVHSIVVGEPDLNGEARSLTEPIRGFIARALAKEPNDRFQTAEEMLAALDRVDEQPGAAAPTGTRWRWVSIAAAIGASILALALLTSDRRGPEEDLSPTGGEIASEASQKGRDQLRQGRRRWLEGNDTDNLEATHRHFERAAGLLPHSTEVQANLAAFLVHYHSFRNNDELFERAKGLIAATLEADSDSAAALAARAWVRCLEGRPLDAERLARRAIALETTCEPGEICDLAYVALGEALLMQERVAEAHAALEEGTRQGDGNIRCRLKRALLYEKSGDARNAEALYVEVLELNDEQTTALRALSQLYMNSRRASEAVPLLSLAHRKTQDPDVLMDLGYARYSRGLWAEAIATYQQAHADYQAADRLMPSPLTAIGDIYLELGEAENAERAYREALEVFDAIENPNLRRQGQEAVCLAKLGRFSEADATISKILGRSVDVPELLVYAARIAALKGDRERLFEIAKIWVARGEEPARLLEGDPAFIPYREDREYLRILEPGLIPAGPPNF